MLRQMFSSLIKHKGARQIDDFALNLSPDELSKVKLSLGDITLGNENKSRIKPPLGPTYGFNSTMPKLQDAKKRNSLLDENTKDRQDTSLTSNLLSTSNIMVKVNKTFKSE